MITGRFCCLVSYTHVHYSSSLFSLVLCLSLICNCFLGVYFTSYEFRLRIQNFRLHVVVYGSLGLWQSSYPGPQKVSAIILVKNPPLILHKILESGKIGPPLLFTHTQGCLCPATSSKLPPPPKKNTKRASIVNPHHAHKDSLFNTPLPQLLLQAVVPPPALSWSRWTPQYSPIQCQPV